MKLFVTFVLLVSSINFNLSYGVPAGALLGCRTVDKKTPLEKLTKCCTDFKLGCDELRIAEKMKITGENPTDKKTNGKKRRFVARTRLLGERCDGKVFLCGIGLHCVHKFCRRVRSEEHLKALLERGKEVEQDEEEEAKQETSFLNSDSEKDVVVKGQAVSIDTQFDDSEGNNGKKKDVLLLDEINDSSIQKMMKKLNLSRLSTKVNHAQKMKERTNFEEDEITSNIADLLSARMGVALDKAERHEIREIIAGTLDERAEREEAMRNGEEKVFEAAKEAANSDNSSPKKVKRGQLASADCNGASPSPDVIGMQCNANSEKYLFSNPLEEASQMVRASTKSVLSVQF